MENNELQKTRPVGGEWPQFYDSHWREGELVEKTKGYALSGKILLSAIVVLFFVIVLMAGLHLYARWYLLRSGRRHRHIRRRRRRTTNLVFYVDPDDNPAAASARGLDPAVLKSLPVFSFTSSEEPAALECAVCLSEFEENEEGRRLPKCNHCFHTECIDMWFHSHATCPLCRAPVAGPDVQVRVFENPPVVPQQVAIAVAEPSPDRDEPGSSSGGPDRGEAKTEPSLVARRKAAELGGVSIEVPRRNASFGRSEEGFGSPSPSPAFKSPGGRMRSLRRILSREIRAALSPSSSAPGCSGSAGPEFDPELAQTPSQRASE